MVKRLLLLTLLVWSMWPSLKACDACACSLSGNAMGMLSPFRNSYISIGYQLAGFQTVPGEGIGSKDQFHTLELGGSYYFSDRFSVQLIQPYRFNFREVEGAQTQLDGLGDTRVLAHYVLFQTKPLGNAFELFTSLGGGIKLPVGKYDPDIHDRNLPENFNLGNGSWGFIFRPNLVLSRREFGLLLSGTFQYFASSHSAYQFGHQTSAQALLFWEKTTSSGFKFIPNTGISQEWIGTDTYANGRSVQGTGGSGTYFTGGVNLQFSKIQIGASYMVPIEQHYSHGEVAADNRLSIQCAYIF